MAADQTSEVIAGFDAARPGVGVVVDAHLVHLGRVDAVEPVGYAGDLNGAAIADDGAGGETGARGKNTRYQYGSEKGS